MRTPEEVKVEALGCLIATIGVLTIFSVVVFIIAMGIRLAFQ